jgi:putative hydroxymethylpyrimidine transport system substrate-binding protein
MNFTRRAFTAAALALSVAGAAPSAGWASDLTKLTFIQEWPVPDGFWIPWILGSEKGFYAEEGIELEIVTPPTVADTMKFLGTGRAQVAFTTVMDVIFAREQQAPVTAIARYGRGNNWGILSEQGNPLAIGDLKGKTIGIYNDAVQTVAATDDTVPLLLQKKVDAITGISNAEATGMMTAGGQTPEFLAATDHGVPNTPIFMLAGNDDWLKENPAVAEAFLRATQKSIAYAAANPDEATAAFGRLYAKAYDEAFIKQQWADTIPLFGDTGADLMVNVDADWVSLLAALKKFDVVANLQEPSAYYSNAYLPK